MTLDMQDFSAKIRSNIITIIVIDTIIVLVAPTMAQVLIKLL